MNTEQEMLEIERERLQMERLRDKHASIRFIVGTVMLAAATTGATLYLSEKQANRILVNEQKQLVIPILMRAEPNDFSEIVSIIDDFIHNADLEPEVVNWLSTRKVRTLQEKHEYEKKLAALEAAQKEEERLRKIALEEERRAQAVAEVEAKKAAEEKARIARENQLAAAKEAEKAIQAHKQSLRKLERIAIF